MPPTLRHDTHPPVPPTLRHHTHPPPLVPALILRQVSFLNAGSGWQESEKVTCHESIVPVMIGGVLSCGLHKLNFELTLPANLPPTIKCITNQSAAKVRCYRMCHVWRMACDL